MECKEAKNIGLYLNNRLNKITKNRFESHLKTCRRCTAELKIFGVLKQAIKEKTSELPEVDVTSKVFNIIAKRESRVRKPASNVFRIAASIPKSRIRRKK